MRRREFSIDTEKVTYSLLAEYFLIQTTGQTIILPDGDTVPRQDQFIAGCVPLEDIPLPAAGTTLNGNKQYEYHCAVGSALGIPISWNLSWTIEPAGTAPPADEVVENACQVEGSIIAVENQSLGEAVDIAARPSACTTRAIASRAGRARLGTRGSRASAAGRSTRTTPTTRPPTRCTSVMAAHAAPHPWVSPSGSGTSI